MLGGVTLHVGQLLHQWALRAPERVALVEGDARWTYGDLDAAAQRAAGALAEAGVEPGDRVLLCAANSGRFVATWFGALYAGAAVVPVPILSAPPEIAFRAEHAGAEVAVADGERRGVAEDDVLAVPLGGDDERAIAVVEAGGEAASEDA